MAARAPVALPLPRPRSLDLDGQGRVLLRQAIRHRGAQRRAFVRDALFRLAGHLTPSLSVDVDGTRFVLNTRDREISRIVWIYGLYDELIMETACRVLSALGRPDVLNDRLLLDVGANIGTTTLTAIGRFSARGSLAFEPDLENLRFLRMNVAANELEARVRVFGMALSDHDGAARLELAALNHGDHRVRKGGPPTPGAHLEIETARLDTIAERGAVELADVGLAWIDVQGHEAHVLAGAEGLRALRAPMVIEYWPEGLAEAGGASRLHDVLNSSYDGFVDLDDAFDGDSPKVRPVTDLPRVTLRGTDAYADVLLI